MWGSTFQDHWSEDREGLRQLSSELKTQDIVVEEPKAASQFKWPLVKNLQSVQDAHFTNTSWGYLSANKKSPWPKSFQFLIVHHSRQSDYDEKNNLGHVLWVSHPEAVLDYLLRKCFSLEWSGPTENCPSHVQAESGVVIGPDCEFGEGCVLEAGVRIGARVKLGARCRIGAYTRISDDTVIGCDTTLASHNSIGNQGFGLFDHPKFPQRRPRLHVGRVVIGSHVHMGSFVTVDRALLGVTQIGDGTCLDSHVHIAHNSQVGQNNVFCAFVGLAGSSQVGDRCTFGAMVGVKDHVRVGNDVLVAAQSGVSAPLKDGAQVKGYPPRPLPEALKISSLQSRLPEIYQRLKNIEKYIKEKKS